MFFSRMFCILFYNYHRAHQVNNFWRNMTSELSCPMGCDGGGGGGGTYPVWPSTAQTTSWPRHNVCTTFIPVNKSGRMYQLLRRMCLVILFLILASRTPAINNVLSWGGRGRGEKGGTLLHQRNSLAEQRDVVFEALRTLLRRPAFKLLDSFLVNVYRSSVPLQLQPKLLSFNVHQNFILYSLKYRDYFCITI